MLGKLSEPSTPFTFMSRMRSWMSKQPGRIWAKDSASRPYSSGTRPATALRPTFGSAAPWNIQTSRPSSCVSTLGADLGGLLRQAPLEEVGRLDDVVVDAHQDQIVDLHCGTPGEM